MPEKTRIAPRAIRTLLGVDPTKAGNEQSTLHSTAFVHRYSKNEKTNLLSKLFVRQENQYNELVAGNLFSYLDPTHTEIAFRSEQFRKLKALAPEIEQSAIIVASSILSPNDLKDGEFSFDFDKIPSIASDPDITARLTKLYSDYFNGTLQLGKESYNWLQDIIYVDGAKAILILPPAIQNKIRDRTYDDIKETGVNQIYNLNTDYLGFKVGTESFEQFTHRPDVASDDFMLSKVNCTWKEYLSNDSLGKTNDVKSYLSELVPAMESFNIPIPTQLKPSSSRDYRSNNPEFYASMESMVVNLRARLQEGDMIKISENPELLRFNVESVLGRKSKLSNTLQSRYGFNNDNNRFPMEEIVTLDVDPNIKHFGHPTLIKLPIESVIPVCVPGAPNEHLGYFIMLDENGSPLTTSEAEAKNKDNASYRTEGSLTNMTYDALFGDNMWRNTLLDNNEVKQTGNIMFNHILDGYIKTRLGNIYGRNDLTISRFNAISSVLFYRLLARKQTTLVFAYTDLLHYFAFDYHDDGTGYAKTEEIAFLVSMRTSFIIASILGKARDAVVHKKVVLGTDNTNTNIEGLMDMAYNVYNAKRKFNTCNINPDDIVNQIYSDAVTIEPRNIPGLSEFSVQTENVSGNNGSDYSSDLVEQLSNFIATRLDVPPSALNQMSEPEYAKSLVTYNLFFAKRIMERQKVYCKQMAEFIHAYVSFDPIIQKAIQNVLASTTHDDAKLTTTEQAKKLIDKNPNDGTYTITNEKDLLSQVIFNVNVSLPNPNLVMDKARFAELSEYMGMLNDVADQYFNSDLIPDSDSAGKSAINLIKAKYKFDMVAKYMNRMGSANIIETPDVGDINMDEVIDFVQTVQNVNARFNQQRTAVSNFSNDTRDNSPSGDYGSSGGDDFGGGMDLSF